MQRDGSGMSRDVEAELQNKKTNAELTRDDMDDTTPEQLETQKQRAALCASVTLLSTELAPLLNIAARAATYNIQTIERLEKRLRGSEVSEVTEVTLTGKEIRLILDLALLALKENRNVRAHLKVVPSSSKTV